MSEREKLVKAQDEARRARAKVCKAWVKVFRAPKEAEGARDEADKALEEAFEARAKTIKALRAYDLEHPQVTK